jgi:hypothetical protein
LKADVEAVETVALMQTIEAMTDAMKPELYGARFSTGIYTQGCHWSHACSLEALASV